MATKGERTRERIVQAADEEFAAVGIEGASTTGIAQRAGVSVGLIYVYFEDKHAVAEEIVSRTESVWRPRWLAVLDDIKKFDDFIDATPQLFDIVSELFETNAGYYRVSETLPEDIMSKTEQVVAQSGFSEIDQQAALTAIQVGILTLTGILARPYAKPTRDMMLEETMQMLTHYWAGRFN